MEHIRIKSIKRDACDFGYNNNMYNNNTSQPKYSTDNLEEAKAPNTYFGQNGYTSDNKYEKFENQPSSEDSFASYYVNAEVWSSDRLRKDKNIYANRYNDTSKRFRGFWHLMGQWKGSVIKLIYHSLLLYITLFMAINMFYRFILYEMYAQHCNWKELEVNRTEECDEECEKNVMYCNAEKGRQWFELFCVYCGRFKILIPIQFLTGFYVGEVVKRYWDQFMSLPVPDRLALKLVTFVPGKDDFTRNLRLTVMRYVNLSIVLVFRLVSTKVEERFPTYQSLVDAKLMLSHEAERLIHCDIKTPHESTWTPMLWALKLLERARSEKKITVEAPVWSGLISAFEYLEINNRRLLQYGWKNFPIAYTQVASFSVYAYFFVSLFGAQYLIPQEDVQDRKTFPNISDSEKGFFSNDDPMKNHTPYLYFPFFSALEFISYMGWIKVAETLVNPFGDDDEDFQINYLIDRNFQVSRMIVDEADMEMEMAPDPFIEAGIEVPANLPYQASNQQEDSYKKVLGEDGEETSITDKIRKISSWTKNGSNADAIGTAAFSRKNSMYGSGKSFASQSGVVKRKRTISDRIAAANQVNQIILNKNERKSSAYNRTNSTSSVSFQLAKDQGNRKVSINEKEDVHVVDFDAIKDESLNDAKVNGVTKMDRITEEQKGDLTVSSCSSAGERKQGLEQLISNMKAPSQRKKAFLVSQLGIDNPTFQDGTSSYTLDPVTLGVSRLNSSDDCVKL